MLEKTKNFAKSLGAFLLGVLIYRMIVLSSHGYLLQQHKLVIMSDLIVEHFYDQAGLKQILKAELGSDYEDNLATDFENFTVKLVLDRLAETDQQIPHSLTSFLSAAFLSFLDDYREAGEVVGKPLDEQVYYLKIASFSYPGLVKEIRDFAKDFKNFPNIIIDLRNNLGGGTHELAKTTEIFLPKGSLMFYDYKNDSVEEYYAKQPLSLGHQKIVLLVNDLTGSSSEFFVQALKENLDNVTVIGVPTYGKSILSLLYRFKDGAGLVFTAGMSHGPNDQPIAVDGIKPDICIGEPDSFFQKIEDQNIREASLAENEKLQLETALKFIYEKL